MNQQQSDDGLQEIQITLYQNGEQVVSVTNTLSATNVSQMLETVFSSSWQNNENEQNQLEQILIQVSEFFDNQNQEHSSKLMSFVPYQLKIQDLEQDLQQMKSQIQSQKKEITQLEQYIKEQNKLLDRYEKLYLRKNEVSKSINSIENKNSQPFQNESQVRQMYKLKPQVETDSQKRQFSKTYMTQQFMNV